jgi:protein AroM
MRCIAAVTIGQSPREDIVAELAPLVPQTRWVQAGALDGFDEARLAALAPAPEEFPLVTRLADGRSVVVGERAIAPLVEQAVARVESEADLVVLLCTGDVACPCSKPVLWPGRLLTAVVPGLAEGRLVAVLTPQEGQVEGQRRRWRARGVEARVLHVPAYAPADLADAGRRAREAGAALVVMDCLGYSRAMKAAVAEASRLPVLLPRSLVARVAAELVGP